MTWARLVVWCAVGAGCGLDGEVESEPDLGPPPPASVGRVDGAAEVGGVRAPVNPRLLRRFRPLRGDPGPADPAHAMRSELGRQLFHDRRLSLGADVACSTCHRLDHGGSDATALSQGSHGRSGVRNTPTVFNAAWSVAQFWDGRAATIEEQARSPLLEVTEMGMTEVGVVRRLTSIPGYVAEFAVAFPGEAAPVTLGNVALALAAYQRALLTPARWDHYLDGDRSALTATELAGMRRFSDLGCVQCHTGELVGGSMFQRAGVAVPWPNQRDQGRFEVTGAEADRMVFKVPSLRNVALTAPYFHDGTAATLAQAIDAMGRHQLGLALHPEEVASIAAWLGALTGSPPTAALAPALPPDGPTTAALLRR